MSKLIGRFRLIAASCGMLLMLPGLLRAQHGSLSGMVLMSAGEKPVPNAEVVISDLGMTVRSDSLGRFSIAEIPAGKHRVTVRHIGYEPYDASLVFKGKEKVEVDFLLDAVNTLATVDVRADVRKRHAARLAEFEQRRRMGFGKFLGPDFFEQNEMLTMQAILSQRFGTLRTTNMSGAAVAATSRGSAPCPVQVYLNGFGAYNGEAVFFDIGILQTAGILAMEFYTPLYTPMEFLKRPKGNTGGSGCGTLMIWTK